MDLEWNQAQKAAYKQYREFAQSHIALDALRNSLANSFASHAWAKLADTDFWRMIIPAKYGGFGEDWWKFVAALEGMASAAQDSGFILTCISQAAIIRGLSVFGTENQKSMYFPRLLAGELTATAIAEPHSGTDLGASESIAKLKDDGSFLLNGKKWNISHAPTAGIILVICKIQADSSSELGLFFVEGNANGLTRGEAQEKMGNRTIPTSWLNFENVVLREKDMFGKLGKGGKTLVETVSLARIFDGWMGAILVEPMLEKAMSFIENRQSQGKPLANHQYIQGKITDILIGISQSRFMGIGALAQLLNGDSAAYSTGSIAKITGVKAMQQAAQHLVEIFGSEGYLEGEISQLLKDAIGYSSIGGTEAAHRMNIFNQYRRRFFVKQKS